MLGAANPVSDYSLGKDLTAGSENQLVVISDWAGVCYLGDGYRFTMPFNSSLELTNKLYDSRDQPVTDVVPFLRSHRADIADVLDNAGKYTR